MNLTQILSDRLAEAKLQIDEANVVLPLIIKENQELKMQNSILQNEVKNAKFKEPIVLSATYGGVDVREKLVVALEQHMIYFEDKAKFNHLFGDPLPGVQKQLIIKYLNIFGEEKTKLVNESNNQTLDLLR